MTPSSGSNERLAAIVETRVARIGAAVPASVRRHDREHAEAGAQPTAQERMFKTVLAIMASFTAPARRGRWRRHSPNIERTISDGT